MEPDNSANIYYPKRLDNYILALHPTVSRAQLQRLVKDGKVRVNNEIQTKNGFMVKESMKVLIDFDFDNRPDLPAIDITVLYEDKHCVVIEKPLGVLTHSKGAFNPEASVASWLSGRENFEFPPDAGINQRAGIVHRLDRATTGVMICAKNPEALKHLQKQFQDRKAKKTYTARIAGEIEPTEALIDIPIERNPKQPQRFRVGQNGKLAQTNYKVIQVIPNGKSVDSIIELKPLTGRTHQLRVHLAYMKHPIVGDTFYDGRRAKRLYLHASVLEITLLNSKRVIFNSVVPSDFYEENI